MQTKFIEATQPTHQNCGKFMLGRFDHDEWQRRSEIGGGGMLHERGWSEHHILVLDLQTGEGAMFYPGGLAKSDLEKHQIWVCPMFEPFLEWLYKQDLSDLNALPAQVEIEAPFSMRGYRRPGKSHMPTTKRRVPNLEKEDAEVFSEFHIG